MPKKRNRALKYQNGIFLKSGVELDYSIRVKKLLQSLDVTKEEIEHLLFRKDERLCLKTKNVAQRLRAELCKLREQEKVRGSSPARRQKMLSRTDIAEVAILLLEDIFLPASDENELVRLFEELLSVDRRRSAFASQPELTEAYYKAAERDAEEIRTGREVGVRDLAKYAGVSVGTIVAWRRSPHYRELVWRIA